MPTIRALRRNYGLTFSDLALISGIPARSLAEIEYGLCPLNDDARTRLEHIFALPAGALRMQLPAPTSASGGLNLLQHLAGAAMVGLVGIMLAAPPAAPPAVLPPVPAAAAVKARVVLPPRAGATGSTRSVAPLESLKPLVRPQPAPTHAPAPSVTPAQPAVVAQPAIATPVPTAEPTVAAPAAYTLQADGPHGCPLQAGVPLRITQGYGVGTHAPAHAWGAVDLVLAEGQTFGAPVFTPLSGVAHVYANSWPGGNFVHVIDERSGWSVAFAHLDRIDVSEGQQVEAGTQVGTIGSTGFSTGPHLHYEVRSPNGNVDPAPLLTCTIVGG